MEELNKQQSATAYTNAYSGVCNIDKMIERLRKCSDKMPLESPEYHLLELALSSLIDAKGHLTIIANRCKQP